MIPEFSSYRVEVKNLKFITNDGVKFPKTAIITFNVAMIGNFNINPCVFKK